MLSKFLQWVRSSIRRRSALLILLIMSFLLAIFIVVDVQVQRHNTEEALLAKGKMIASTGAAISQHILEEAISTGTLTEAQVFDTNYIPIPDTDPQKYHTSYDFYTDEHAVKIQDGFLQDSDISFAIMVDINGYLPTHNTIYAMPLTGDVDIDLINNRTKRIFDDETGLAAAQNLEPHLHQIYYRDTGEVIWDISSPIIVNGKHWGAFRVGLSLLQVNKQLSAITWRMYIAAAFMILAIFIAAFFVTRPMTLINDLSQMADKIAIGITPEPFQIERLDELGRLGDAFNKIIEYHQSMTSAAESISNGDLSIKIAAKSKNDNLGNAFINMVESLRQSIKALEKERSLLQTLIDSSADMIYFKDHKSRFIRISQSQANRFGLVDVAQAEGKTDFDFFSKEHALNAFTDEQNIIQTGNPIIDIEEEEVWPDGHKNWVSSTKMPFYNEDGQIIGTFGISHDITERKTMENKLRDSRDKMLHEIEQRKIMQELLNTEKEILNTTLMSINEAVIATDHEGLVTFFNKAAESIVGYAKNEVLDFPIATAFKILNPESEEKIENVIEYLYQLEKLQKKAASGKSPILITKSGDKIIVKGSISTIFTSEKSIKGHVLVFQDVTQTQKLETQTALSLKMESIGQMASGIAHEINTPIQYVGDNLRYLNRSFAKMITAIDTYQQWLQSHTDVLYSQSELASLLDSTDPKKLQMYIKESPVAIDESLSGVERVRKIVLAMREFSHPSLKEKRFSDINHAIETTVTISRNEWKYVAELDMDLDPELPLVNCQIDEINQVLLNMLINSGHAIKEVVDQNPELKGKITIQTRIHENWVQIILTDTGAGIPDALIGRIFDPFFTTKGIGEGTGQGLYLSHNIIVNKHSGRISVESEEGKGTTFLIELPIDPDRGENENA
ncbi:MAG: PAS domain S-box protein [Anaerolineaceae bacterium]|nr:PAS domain S-box protein [Anaerolineaceae bacterium]